MVALNEKSVTILGATGSIGRQSLMVCDNLGLPVEVLTAGRNIALLEKQARKYHPQRVVIADEKKYSALKTALADTSIRVEAGQDALCAAAAHPAGTVIDAIVGIAGLRPALAALQAGNRLALANKETLVTGGALVMQAAADCGTEIIPVDSEHAAIYQCLLAGRREDVSGVILTASGGPFVGKTKAELASVKAAQALVHPNWSMGAKITIDSATLMNKGLEFIETMWLFSLQPEQIEVVVHRQSLLHSAVVYQDGAVIAQMSVPDMRLAIQYALTAPHRQGGCCEPLPLTRYGTLTFEPPDTDTFSCLATCIHAAKLGGLAPCIANGANEQAVALFLQGRIGFLDIGEAVAQAVDDLPHDGGTGLDAIEAADKAAREFVLARYT